MLHALLIVDFVFVFLIGAAVGSFVNVCVARLPYEKSLLWPGSRCGQCFQPIRSYDNIPLISYWVLRGRCRSCGARFSISYFLVELCTALSFVGLFYLVVYCQPLRPPLFRDFPHAWRLSVGLVPWQGWAMFAHIAILFTFLLITSLCDLKDMEIPLPVTVTGTLVGLLLSTALAWPFPEPAQTPRPPPQVPPVPGMEGLPFPLLPDLPLVLHRCPVWIERGTGQPPGWIPAGSWRLGLATGLVGALAGMLMMRGIRFLWGVGRGSEGLGIGDADLMMMAGAFLGWQVVVVGLLAAVFPALLLGLLQLARRGEQALPFGPPLAAGVLLAYFGWPWMDRRYVALFFDSTLVLLLGGGGAFIFLVASFLLRLLRGGSAEVPAA